MVRRVAALAAACVLAACAGRHPPEPLRVRVYAAPGEIKDARLQEAVAAVRDRVRERDRWFRLADSADRFDVGLRLTGYRIERARPGLSPDAIETVRIHVIEGVAAIDDRTEALTGFDSREVEFSRLRHAAGDLVEKLERFCRENLDRFE